MRSSFLRELHRLGIEAEVRGGCGGVGRVAEHDRERLGDRMPDRPLDAAQELGVRIFRGRCASGGRNVADRGAGNDEAELVNRIGRARYQDHIAGRRYGLRHVGEAFLRAERRDHLGFGVELHAEPARVVGGLRLAQARDALGRGIAIGARLADRLDQLVDDVLGRGHVGVAHAEIDDVGAARAGGRLQAVDFGENIRRKAFDAVEFFDHWD